VGVFSSHGPQGLRPSGGDEPSHGLIGALFVAGFLGPVRFGRFGDTGGGCVFSDCGNLSGSRASFIFRFGGLARW